MTLAKAVTMGVNYFGQPRRTYLSYSFDSVVPGNIIHVYGKIGAGKLANANSINWIQYKMEG